GGQGLLVRPAGRAGQPGQVEGGHVGLGERPLVGVGVVTGLHRDALVVEQRAVLDGQVLLQRREARRGPGGVVGGAGGRGVGQRGRRGEDGGQGHSRGGYRGTG